MADKDTGTKHHQMRDEKSLERRGAAHGCAGLSCRDNDSEVSIVNELNELRACPTPRLVASTWEFDVDVTTPVQVLRLHCASRQV